MNENEKKTNPDEAKTNLALNDEETAAASGGMDFSKLIEQTAQSVEEAQKNIQKNPIDPYLQRFDPRAPKK